MASYLHTCYRIGDIDRSVEFYEALGFEERRRMPIRDEAINVFMGLPGDGDRLELTYNHGVDSYDLGTGYNHIALGVEDLEGTLACIDFSMAELLRGGVTTVESCAVALAMAGGRPDYMPVIVAARGNAEDAEPPRVADGGRELGQGIEAGLRDDAEVAGERDLDDLRARGAAANHVA